MPRLLVLGYFGAGNLGDDAILTAWLKSRAAWLRDRSLRLSIVARNSCPLDGFVETPELAPLIESTVSPLQALRLDAREYAALVAPGGSLLQDRTSVRSLALYLTLIERFRASMHGAFMLNQGLGPLCRAISRTATAAVLCRVSLVSLRDACSFDLATGMPALSARRDMLLSCDPATAVPLEAEAEWNGALELTSPYFAIVPKGVPPGLAEAVETIAGLTGLRPVIVPLHEPQDLAVAKLLAERQPDASLITSEAASKLGPPNSVRIGVLAGATLVISVRLHALILAAAAGVPALGLGYDPKVEAFCAEVGYPCLRLDASGPRITASATAAMTSFDSAAHVQRLGALRARYSAAEQRLNEVWLA